MFTLYNKTTFALEIITASSLSSRKQKMYQWTAHVKLYFQFDLPKKIISDAGFNFILAKFKRFGNNLK